MPSHTIDSLPVVRSALSEVFEQNDVAKIMIIIKPFVDLRDEALDQGLDYRARITELQTCINHGVEERRRLQRIIDQMIADKDVPF